MQDENLWNLFNLLIFYYQREIIQRYCWCAVRSVDDVYIKDGRTSVQIG